VPTNGDHGPGGPIPDCGSLALDVVGDLADGRPTVRPGLDTAV
jgi:hypothetical protein